MGVRRPRRNEHAVRLRGDCHACGGQLHSEEADDSRQPRRGERVRFVRCDRKRVGMVWTSVATITTACQPTAHGQRGDRQSRRLRGGSWGLTELKLCRSALRYQDAPDARSLIYGFRVTVAK